MPGITEDMMNQGGMTTNYRQIAKLTNKVAQILEKGEIVKITTPSGTLTSERHRPLPQKG